MMDKVVIIKAPLELLSRMEDVVRQGGNLYRVPVILMPLEAEMSELSLEGLVELRDKVDKVIKDKEEVDKDAL